LDGYFKKPESKNMLSTLLKTRLARRICSSRHEVSKFKSHNTIETCVKHELNHAMLYAKPCKALQRILIGIIDGMYYNVHWGGFFFFWGKILKIIKMKNKVMMFFF
jgi:hypothetical protein